MAKISIIIPIYNEEQTIGTCLVSLAKQEGVSMEVMVVDDGSTDQSVTVAQEAARQQGLSLTLLRQQHLGPGQARNLAAAQATGDILVFVDADMTFAPNFVNRLVAPIISGEAKGMFTKEEYVSNWESVWARCWNYAQGLPGKRRIPASFPATAPVFRAILKSEFQRVGGFDPIGYTDDWTVSRKLGYQASAAAGAVCYHHNPDSLREVYHHAQWIGKNEFISGSLLRRLYNGVRYFPLVQGLVGIADAMRYKMPEMIVFRCVYATGICSSLLFSWNGKGYHE